MKSTDISGSNSDSTAPAQQRVTSDPFVEMGRYGKEDNKSAMMMKVNNGDLKVPLTQSGDISGSTDADATAAAESDSSSGWWCGLDAVCNRAIEMLKLSVPQQNSADHNDLERTGFMFFIAFAFRFTFIFVLLYVGITDYLTQLDNEYLSPSVSSGDCENISVSVRSTYVSDYYGHWETQRNYQFTDSIYTLEFMGLEVSFEQYVANMKAFQSRLQALSTKAKERDIGYTLVALASFHMQDDEEAMEFKFNTFTPQVFNYYTFDFSIGSRDGFCVPFNQYPIYADYDKGSATITYEVQVDNSTAQPCDQLIVFHYVNNNYAIQSDGVLQIPFDMRTISTAVAVNNGILKVKRDLKPVLSDAYNVTAYIDPNYSDMTPMACYPGVTDDDPDVCLVWSPNYFLMYPSITQMGKVGTTEPCNCPIAAEDEWRCDIVSIIVGLLVINIEDRDMQEDAMYNFTRQFVNLRKEDPVNGDLAASNLFFDAHIRIHNAVNTTEVERQQAFDKICGDVPCSIFHIELNGDYPFISINNQGTQLSKLYADRDPAACKETLYQSTAFEPIVGVPPVSLQESYFVCTSYPGPALQRAIGVAAGSAQLYSSIILALLVMGIVFVYNQLHGSNRIVNPHIKKRILEERLRYLESTNQQLQNDLALALKCNASLEKKLDESNARMQRQFDEFAKSLGKM